MNSRTFEYKLKSIENWVTITNDCLQYHNMAVMLSSYYLNYIIIRCSNILLPEIIDYIGSMIIKRCINF